MSLVLTPVVEKFQFQPPGGGPPITEVDSTTFVYIDNADGTPASVDLPQFPGALHPRRPIFTRAAGEAVLAGAGPLGIAAAQAELAAFRANSVPIYYTTFSFSVTPDDDSIPWTYELTITHQRGSRVIQRMGVGAMHPEENSLLTNPDAASAAVTSIVGATAGDVTKVVAPGSTYGLRSQVIDG